MSKEGYVNAQLVHVAQREGRSGVRELGSEEGSGELNVEKSITQGEGGRVWEILFGKYRFLKRELREKLVNCMNSWICSL